MTITILCENQVGHAGARTCLAEWGLSVLIQTERASILFDAGHTDVYWKNALAMGIDLQRTDALMLSHRHWDHAGGLQHHAFAQKKPLIFHPRVMDALPEKEAEKLKRDFDITMSSDPLEYADGIFFLGQIPRETAFETGSYGADSMPDDTAVAVKSKNGAIVVTGCSHSGVCNICEHAKRVTGQELYAVIGGFHLFERETDAVEGTIKYFRRERPAHLYPMHCVDFPTLTRFRTEFGIQKASTGDTITLDA